MGIRQIKFCDISGLEGDVETHELNIDQMHVEIDLAPGEHRKLLDLLQPYIQAGRVEASARNFATPPAKKAKGPRLTPAERDQLREWADANGIAVPANSRFKNSLIAQWRTATGSSGSEPPG